MLVSEKPLGRARTTALLALLVLLAPAAARATWSVVAVDATSGEIVIASATCLPQQVLRTLPASGLRDIQAVVVPGIGAGVAQARIDPARRGQRLIHEGLAAGASPQEILTRLHDDPAIEQRQYAIVDRHGRGAVHTGAETIATASGATGSLADTGIHFAVAGNLLASPAVIDEAVAAFRGRSGALSDRVLAAMEAADAAGGDRRCTCFTQPLPDASCDLRTSQVAYLLVAAADDEPGATPAEGGWSLLIEVTDENIEPHEHANPVRTLRLRYDERLRGGVDGTIRIPQTPPRR